jgi:hypothetical protein
VNLAKKRLKNEGSKRKGGGSMVKKVAAGS